MMFFPITIAVWHGTQYVQYFWLMKSSFACLQWLWRRETWGTHAVSRCPIPPDYLCANNATAAAKRYRSYVCMMIPQESGESLSAAPQGQPIISSNQGWVLERSISPLLSVLLVPLFGCEDQRDTTPVMGGLHLLRVPFICGLTLHLLHRSPSLKGPPKDLSQHTAVMFKGGRVAAGRSFHWWLN